MQSLSELTVELLATQCYSASPIHPATLAASFTHHWQLTELLLIWHGEQV